MLARYALASVLFLSYAAAAQDAVLPTAKQLKTLANNQQWAHLLHYRKHPFSGRYISENDSPNFFLAPGGKTSLLAELEANLE